MKKVLLLLFVVFSIAAQAQVYKFTATHSNYLLEEVWGEWKDTEILIVVNFDKSSIQIYSKDIQTYDIIQFQDNAIYPDYEESSMLCVDKEGIRCTVDLVTYKSERNPELYVKWKNAQLVYSIIPKN